MPISGQDMKFPLVSMGTIWYYHLHFWNDHHSFTISNEGEKVEMQTKRMPFQCPICEVRFAKKESLDLHLSEDHKGSIFSKAIFILC